MLANIDVVLCRTCVISALRISVLSTMDFTDITYTIPLANIFSGLEPCLAIVLASVPMMRPLLGQSAYSQNATGPKSSSPSTGPKQPSDGFQPLDDDTSQLWLRPMGPKHSAGISVQKMGSRDTTADSSESLDGPGHGMSDNMGNTSPGIRIQQEWAVHGGR